MVSSGLRETLYFTIQNNVDGATAVYVQFCSWMLNRTKHAFVKVSHSVFIHTLNHRSFRVLYKQNITSFKTSFHQHIYWQKLVLKLVIFYLYRTVKNL